MDDILHHLKDPSWWFTAFFVAILASVIAAYLREYIGKGLAFFSGHFRIRRDRRLAKLDHIARSIAASEPLLIIEFLRSIALLILWIFVFALFIGCFIA